MFIFFFWKSRFHVIMVGFKSNLSPTTRTCSFKLRITFLALFLNIDTASFEFDLEPVTRPFSLTACIWDKGTSKKVVANVTSPPPLSWIRKFTTTPKIVQRIVVAKKERSNRFIYNEHSFESTCVFTLSTMVWRVACVSHSVCSYYYRESIQK